MLDHQTRRAALLGLKAILLLAVTVCRSDAPVYLPPEQATARLASTVYTADPNAGAQLLAGFYRIEEYSWRWTTQRFSVVLRPPGGAGEAANLVVQLGIPEAVVATLHSISLSAEVSGSRLEPETYSRPGAYKYVRGIAPKLLTSEEMHIDFQLDKVMPPSGQDERRLGIVVTSIGLEPQ